jgi:hypothetical protein
MENEIISISETQEQYEARCNRDMTRSQKVYLSAYGYENWSGEESDEEMSEEEFLEMFPEGCIWA